MSKGLKEIWQNFIKHTKSSRFCIIIMVLVFSFVAALIHAFKPSFPFTAFTGIINSLGLGSYILKTFGAGEKERRMNNLNNEG